MDENCNSNEKEQERYVDPANAFFVFSIIYNNEEFVADKYGDNSILRESNYYGANYRISRDKKKVFNFEIQEMQLNDQTDLLQFGNPNETLFHTPLTTQMN